MKTIEITITPTGETKIETKGFSGSTCRDASKFVEDALGSRVSEALTAEFHQEHSQQQQTQQGA